MLLFFTVQFHYLDGCYHTHAPSVVPWPAICILLFYFFSDATNVLAASSLLAGFDR